MITALLNGDIRTMEGPDDWAQAALLENGRILRLGTTDLIKGILEGLKDEPEIRVIDLKGRTVLPGFIDSHLHFESYGLSLLQVDLKYPAIRSIEDIREALEKEKGKRDWIVGNLYDHNKLKEGRHPNKWDLDQVSRDQPILIFHISGHMVAVNSKALELAGITDKTPDPAGGRIERSVSGEATGVLFETAFNLVIDLIPPDSSADREDALKTAMSRLLAKGITSVHDMGVEDYSVDLKLFHELLDKGQLKTRINILYPFSDPDRAESKLNDKQSDFNVYKSRNNDFVKLSGLKCFSDGSLVGRTAAVKRPYKDGTGTGMLLMDQERLTRMAELAYGHDLQLGIHAIGDRAIENCLSAFSSVMGKDGAERRFRIEHCGIGSAETFETMKEMNILVASQPAFLQDFGDGILLNYDDIVTCHVYAFRDMLDHGIHLSFGSDAPVTEPDPLSAIRCAVCRRTENGQDFEPAQNISLYEALLCFTLEGAYASFEEDRKGLIKEGYLADLVVLSDRLTAQNLHEATVQMTILNGVIEYERS